MKTLLAIILIAFVLPAWSQSRLTNAPGGTTTGRSGQLPTNTNGFSNGEQSQEQDEHDLEHESKQDSIKPRVHAWKLNADFSVLKPVVLDTGMMNFHNYDPIFKKSISNTTQGYYGGAYQSNIFIDRDYSSNFYFLRSFDAYTIFQPDVQYYNTTTPYSYLRYIYGQENTTTPEQTFEAFHTQNIDPYTNFGFRFNTIKSNGHYPAQFGHHRYMNAFFTRHYGNYEGFLSFIRSKNTLMENGGLAKPEEFSPKILTDRLTTKFGSGTISDHIHYSLFTKHEYKFEFPKTVVDTLDSIAPKPRGSEYGIEYMLHLESYKRNYTETALNNMYYSNLYTDTLAGYNDSIRLQRVVNRFQLKAYESEYRRFTFNARAYIENELVWAVHPIRSGQTSYQFGNMILGGELSRNNGILGTWSGTARFVMLGRNLGDALVKGTYEKSFNLWTDTLSFRLQGWYQDQSADIFEERMVLNRMKWENNFKKEHRVVLNAEAEIPDYRLLGGANYTLLSNYLYVNNLAMPDQYTNEFSLLTAWAEKKTLFGHFGWDNKVVWQALSDTRALQLPTWSIYSNIFFHHTLFKVMKLQIGGELFYHTSFFAPKYEPVTSQFYNQRETKTGGYPLLNGYANLKLKRTSGFVKVYHPAYYILGGKYMSSPSYPLSDMTIRFGFLWSFYD